MVYEAQLLFASVLGASAYLTFRVLDAGLLGSLSVKYFAWAGKTEERRRLDVALNAEKASIFFKVPPTSTEAREKFKEHIANVPVDEATGEVQLAGPLYKKWLEDTKKLLMERTCEVVKAYRTAEQYRKETFCKMSQGLATHRAYRDAEAARQMCELELQDIVEWAKRLRKGWEESIIKEGVKLVDHQVMTEMRAQQLAEERAMQEQQRMMEERQKQKLADAESRHGHKEDLSMPSPSPEPSDADADAAKRAEEELLRESETGKSSSGKKKNSKKG